MRITVVSVVFNGFSEIESTIKSVLNQNYNDVQYIIVDGGSTDGTCEIIHDYLDYIDVYVSEKDSGIYDAMNKSVGKANGEYIFFLNVGDVFCRENVLEQIVSQIDNKEDVIFGNNEIDYGFFNRINKPLPLEELKYGMVFSHQGVFIKTKILRQFPFNTKFKFAADYDLVYKLYNLGYSFKQLDIDIAQLKSMGVSEINIEKTYIERWRISRSYISSHQVFIHDVIHLKMMCKVFLIKQFKRILPYNLLVKFTKMKYGA